MELHSAITGHVTEIARMIIANRGTGTPTLGHYDAMTLRGRSRAVLDAIVPQRRGRVDDWPRERLHVWNLVHEALRRMGYGRAGATPEPAEEAGT